ncbi:MAG: hypothetical protein MH204_01590 [Fimbriimonadaceae bacterium]|nr:hypothetical protein [Fimbriimonadaceae bacterium]
MSYWTGTTHRASLAWTYVSSEDVSIPDKLTLTAPGELPFVVAETIWNSDGSIAGLQDYANGIFHPAGGSSSSYFRSVDRRQDCIRD